MRSEYLECTTIEEAEELATFDGFLVKAGDGYMNFESSEDMEIWENQK